MLFKKTAYDCHQATFLSIKKDEGQITFVERMKLSYHLFLCDPCRNFVAQSALITKFGRQANEGHLTLSATARDRIKKSLGGL